jgi:hypothetical protein
MHSVKRGRAKCARVAAFTAYRQSDRLGWIELIRLIWRKGGISVVTLGGKPKRIRAASPPQAGTRRYRIATLALSYHAAGLSVLHISKGAGSGNVTWGVLRQGLWLTWPRYTT